MSAKAAQNGANVLIQIFVTARTECVEDAIVELNEKFRNNHSLCLVLIRMLKKKDNEALLDGSLGSSTDVVGGDAEVVVPVEKIIRLKPFQKRWRNLEGTENLNFVFAVLNAIRPVIFATLDDWNDFQKDEMIKVLMCILNVERDMLLPGMFSPSAWS